MLSILLSLRQLALAYIKGWENISHLRPAPVVMSVWSTRKNFPSPSLVTMQVAGRHTTRA